MMAQNNSDYKEMMDDDMEMEYALQMQQLMQQSQRN